MLSLAWMVVLPGGAAAPGVLVSRVPWTANRVVGSPEPPPPYSLRRVFPEVAFEHPVDFSTMPGSSRIFVAEQSGKLWSLDCGSARPKAELVLDLRRHRQPLDSILGFTFHPGFATNRYVYINYNEPGYRENGAHVSRFLVASADTPTIDPGSELKIIQWLSGGHNGCTLAFGNDGFLYISTGDAADPDPPDGKRKTGQDISDLLASVLRIDVDRPDGTNAYSIPADNPFLGTSGARAEVWSFGFRNPYRMSFDRETGDLWLGDVGWELWEMIYRVQRGGNYGWSLTEGPNPIVRRDVEPGPGPIRAPIIALPHTEAASVTGGVVYRGRRLPKLRGAYVYGDWETGKFWALRHRDGSLASNQELCDTALKPVAFALDREGELLVLDYNGGIYEFVENVDSATGTDFPGRLSETGLFRSLRPLQPELGTIPYRIAAPMWNDYATAEWLLAIPDRGTIATTGGVGNIAGSTWFFPSNTVLARTLSLRLSADQEVSARRIETQILHWNGQAWNPYTYQWRPDQTDGDLVPRQGTNDTYLVSDPSAPGGHRTIPWRFLGRAECLRCHNAWSGEALTLSFQQLGDPREPQSDAARLVNLGAIRLTGPRPAFEPLADPYDESFPLGHRARSWLHVNCSTCHRFGAGGIAQIHLNVEKPLAETRVIDVKPLRGDFDLRGARIIAAADPYRSTLFFRVFSEGSGRMPHVGSRLADLQGLRLLKAWISSLPASQTSDPETTAARSLSQEYVGLLEKVRSGYDPAPVGELLSTLNGSLALLSDVCLQSSMLPSNVVAVTAVAAQHTNALVRELFQRLLPADQRRTTLGTEIHPSTILALKGDAARGREIFVGLSQCFRCHVCGGTGQSFGPPLDGIGQRYTRSQLLAQILEPSANIANGYQTTTLILRDGTEVNGFVLRKTDSSLIIREDALNERAIALGDIAEQRQSQLSAMPDGLLSPLTAGEAADLVEFLSLPSKAGH